MKRATVFKIIGGVAIGIIVIVAAVVSLVFYATSGVTKAADQFFEQARAGDIESVYALTSAELRNVTSAEQLAYFIEVNRFDQVAETSWSSRSIKNNVGSVAGSVTLDDGGVVPLSMRLVSEEDEWRISSIELADAGVAGGGGSAEARPAGDANVPPDNVVLSLARFHTGVFFDAAQRGDFEYFQGFWIEGVTQDELRELAGAMGQAAGAAEALENARPVIEGVAPYEDGGFETKGHYEASDWRYEFAYAFVPDGEDWNLASFNYNIDRTS